MPRYTDDSKDRVRDAIDMVDLVGSRVELRRSGGSSFSGLCPFHDERSPSFSVDSAKKLYHCFGCGEGGDGFTFVQKLEGLDFVGSLEYLADRYKVPLEVVEEDPRAAEKRMRRERLLELLERATTFYVRTLWEADEAAPAREYLAERGLDEGLLREFRVGYAPSAWDRLLLAGRKAGFSNHDLYDAGLAQRKGGDGQIYDRFRRRIMFPLADRRGRVLGFGARALGSDQQPKYLNTSENELFVKGRQLFGADVARAHAAKAGATIVAEGYTDVIALHQAGMRNAVGIMGTAMTAEQVEALGGLAPRVLLALDADGAGQEAMLRAERVARQRSLDLRVVPLPPGSDPADLVRAEGAKAVADLVDAAMPFAQFSVQREVAKADLSSAEGKDQLIDRLGPVFAPLPQSVMRQELTHYVADRLDLPEAMVADLLARSAARAPARESSSAPPRAGAVAAGPRGAGFASGGMASGPYGGEEGLPMGPPPPPEPPRAVSRSERIERTFLALCIALPTHGHEALDRVTDDYFSTALNVRALHHLRIHLASPTDGIAEDDAELSRLMTELAVRASRGAPKRETLHVEELQLELARIDRAIAAVRAGGEGSIGDLAAKRGRVKAELDAGMDSAMEASS